MKAIKGLRFYTYQEAANWLECSVTEVEEMVAHKELLAYRFSHDEEPGIRNERYLSHEMALELLLSSLTFRAPSFL